CIIGWREVQTRVFRCTVDCPVCGFRNGFRNTRVKRQSADWTVYGTLTVILKTFELALSGLTTCTVFSPDTRPNFFILPARRIDPSEASAILILRSTPFTKTIGETPNPLPSMVKRFLPSKLTALIDGRSLAPPS